MKSFVHLENSFKVAQALVNFLDVNESVVDVELVNVYENLLYLRDLDVLGVSNAVVLVAV